MPDFDGFTTLSFDCYGTLIDWETGIANALLPWAERASLALSGEDLIAAHARHETAVQQQQPTAAYPDVLAEALRRIGAERGARVTDDDAAAYGASVGDWPAFADAVDALTRLQGSYRLAILSNVDRASFTRSNARLGVEFNCIVTAEDVGSYKPDLANFSFLFERLADLGVQRSEVLHVAESLYHDHEPAQAMGIPSVWIHRRHDKGGSGAAAAPRRSIRPQWRFMSLAAFAEAAGV